MQVGSVSGGCARAALQLLPTIVALQTWGSLVVAGRSHRASLVWALGSHSQILLSPGTQHQPPLLIVGRAASLCLPLRFSLLILSHLQHVPAAYINSWPVLQKQCWAGANISCGCSWQVPAGVRDIHPGLQVMLLHHPPSCDPRQLPRSPAGTCLQLMPAHSQCCFHCMGRELV